MPVFFMNFFLPWFSVFLALSVLLPMDKLNMQFISVEGELSDDFFQVSCPVR